MLSMFNKPSCQRITLNPGFEEEGDDHSFLSFDRSSCVSVYIEEMDGRLFLRIIDLGSEVCTQVFDLDEAKKIHAALTKLIPRVKNRSDWENRVIDCVEAVK